jgi:hypothetical protein
MTWKALSTGKESTLSTTVPIRSGMALKTWPPQSDAVNNPAALGQYHVKFCCIMSCYICLVHCAASRKVVGSIPVGVIGIHH